MNTGEPFDPLVRFAEIEWLVAKIYYRLSHLFLDRTELRDFWWDMAKEEEQHASILIACKSLIDNYEDEKLDPEITRAKADELKQKLLSHLNRGTAALSVDESFRIALQIESSEIDAIYSKLLQLGGPKIAKTVENLGVPASVQRQRLKSALRQFCKDPQIIREADGI
jgi:rubrerythrin